MNMRSRSERPLTTCRTLFAATAWVTVLVVPVVVGALATPRPSAQSSARASAGQSPAAAGSRPAFEVASIKPNHAADSRSFIQLHPGRFVATGATARFLIQFAYDAQDFQVSGGPTWITSNKYDVDAKEEDSIAKELETLTPFQRMDQIRMMIQSLLADRFKLNVSRDTKDVAVYVLVVAKNGPKLTQTAVTSPETAAGNPHGPPPNGPRIGITGNGQVTATGVPVSLLAEILSHQLGREVVDHTGLKGNYDFKLQWTPDENQPLSGPDGGPTQTPANAAPPDSSGPSLPTALQEQLGLRLESQKAPVDVFVIDHVEEPSPN
jgi:bla regulator protein blaR1